LVFKKEGSSTGVETLRKSVECEDLEWTQFCAYAAAVYQNTGNFHSFGDNKFVPELPEDRFVHICKSSNAYKNEENKSIIDTILEGTLKEIYSEEAPLGRVGFKDKGGQTSYYSGNITSEDNDFIDKHLC
jgi:dipeptidyl-peptidase-3